MKIALIQQACSHDHAANRQRGLAAAAQAADAGAQVICFAELAFERFYPQRPAEGDVKALAEEIPGETTEMFSQLAREKRCVIVLNLFERDGDRTYDTSPVIGVNGELLGRTRMIHITDYACFHERGFYDPGDLGAPVYDTPFGRIGVAICYDRHFPEYMRALSLAGAQVVFVPQAGAVGEWPDGLYEAELRVAAFQNGYFTALCNRVGQEECLEFGGESFVCSPRGVVIAALKAGVEETLLVELNLDEIKSCEATRLFLADRRPDLYTEWFKS